jgi:hypothetical protein
VDIHPAERGRGHGQRGVEQAHVPHAVRSAIAPDLIGVDAEDFVQGEEDRTAGYSASRLKTPA